MATNTILLIDDDEVLLELISDHVHMAGYKTITASNGPSGVEMALEHRPNLVVLDVMMPKMDGWDVIEQIRQSHNLPIIMLTAKGEEADKLRGFRLGVDDYITKPFSFAELVARISAVLARTKAHSNAKEFYEANDLTIRFDERAVTAAGVEISLTPTEYRLLKALSKYPGRTVPTEQLLIEVWGQAYLGELEHVKHYIWSLRKKIEKDPGDPKHIITERGFGYRFE